MVFSQRFTSYRSSSRKKNLKIHRLFADGLDFEETQFPVKIKDIHKIEKNNSVGISML